jgi:hypothetical protein
MQTAVITRKLPNGQTETTIRLRVNDELKAEVIFLSDEVPSSALLATYAYKMQRILE